MFGFFKSKKTKAKKLTDKERSDLLRAQVKAQIKQKREEMDPEVLEKLQQALRIKKAKKEVQNIVDQDDRRGEVVDQIRTMRNDKSE